LITERCQRIGNNTLVLNGKGNLQEQPVGYTPFEATKSALRKRKSLGIEVVKCLNGFPSDRKSAIQQGLHAMYMGKDLRRPSHGFSDSTTDIPTLQQITCRK